MALILNIDTATDIASVCLSHHGVSLGVIQNPHQKEHASFIHAGIQQLLKDAGIAPRELEAIAVTNGPGSYTGLRVGLATAKGLCYALQIPLITANTLKVMTVAAVNEAKKNKVTNTIFCPMIDARRMEVFTALYKADFTVIMNPCAMILDSASFYKNMTKINILFFGSGSQKFREICTAENALFSIVSHDASQLVTLAEQAFTTKSFTNLAYAEPDYHKEFYTPNAAL